eukprot:TRINITY_DN15871_c0_g2_i1.p1 TRINITY_DN15871_c0_g2~~TRINITY_DN15871_c0_g2_i1.p1  ORF type:complete len:147 (+),score=3.04 TRINITY_DN15871_c0_g2_i1:377-817(+)
MPDSSILRRRGRSSDSFLQPLDALKDFSVHRLSQKAFAYAGKLVNFLYRSFSRKETEKPKSSSYVEDNSWIAVALSICKIVACFLAMMVTTFFWAIIMLLLLPWPYERIRQGNIYGHVTGRMLVGLLLPPNYLVLIIFSKKQFLCF